MRDTMRSDQIHFPRLRPQVNMASRRFGLSTEEKEELQQSAALLILEQQKRFETSILLPDDFANLQTLTPCGRRSFASPQWLHFHVERVYMAGGMAGGGPSEEASEPAAVAGNHARCGV